jgi:hypothetical protein
MYKTTRANSVIVKSGTYTVIGIVIVLTMVSIQRAYAAVAVANALITSRVTAAAGTSAGITIPPVNQPVLVGVSTTSPSTLLGTASGAVTRHSVGGNSISSAFVNSEGTTPATLAVASAIVGQDLAYVSPGGVNTANTVEIGPVNTQIRVENDEAVATTTIFTMVW